MSIQPSLFNIEEIFERIENRAPSGALGIEYNPFPPTGIAGGNGASVAQFYLRNEYALQLGDFVRSALQGNDFCGLIVIGEYGSGKTSLLQYFASAATEARTKGVPITAIYVSSPGTSFADILQSMTRSIGREILQKYAWAHVIKELKQRVVDQDLSSLALPVPTNEQVSRVDDAHGFWSLFRDNLGVSKAVLVAATNDLMHESLPDPGFADDLVTVMLGDRGEAGRTWTQLTRPWPPRSSKKPVVTDRMASFMTILRSNGIKHLFLLVDEFEDTVFNRLSKTLRDDFTATLRGMIGEEGHEVSIVFASNFPGWQSLVRSDPALESRFKFRIEFAELSNSDIFRLINAYVEPALVDAEDSAGNIFSPEFCELLRGYVMPNPRPLLTACYSVVEYFWDAKRTPKVSEIEKYLANRL